jgi:hypothetical protein
VSSFPPARIPGRCASPTSTPANVLFETEIAAGRVNSTKRYYVRFRLEIWQAGERVLTHDYGAAGREC